MAQLLCIIPLLLHSFEAIVAAEESWFKNVYWNDSLCTNYAGEQAWQLNYCSEYHQVGSLESLKYSYSFNNGIYTLTAPTYTGTTCSGTPKDQIQFLFNAGCTYNQSSGYYYTSSIVSSATTSFPVDGLLIRGSDTSAHCSSNLNVFAYLFMPYASTICYPFPPGTKNIASCGDTLHVCSGALTTSTSYSCSSGQKGYFAYGQSAFTVMECWSSSDASSNNNSETTYIIVGCVVGGFALLACLGLCWRYFVNKKGKEDEKKLIDRT